MKINNYGRIINIISTSVKQPIEGLGVSNTIRGAVANWSKTLASELGPFGITVNNVLPGATATERLDQIMINIGKKNRKIT
jgi:3-oxoacyl-[acyl-carrier protein] reductase